MEHLLNLLWLAVSATLFLAVLRARSLGILRCSFALALGCAVLLAIFLFPAVSMTDDLQRAKLDAETAGRSLGDTLLTLPFHVHLQAVLLPGLLLLIQSAARLIAAGRLMRSSDRGLVRKTRSVRPQAVRPPPFPAAA